MKTVLFSNKKRRRAFIIISAAALLLITAVAVCAIYVSDYYRADEEAIEVFSGGGISWRQTQSGDIVFEPEGATCGLIFYPGGKVEHTAYVPLLQACAERGILCVIVKMPFRLAVLDVNAADGICEEYPEIQNWYIGGHSLGGSMAASYLSGKPSDYKGLILLGSYSTADISAAGIDVLSIYGSEDKVMNHEKYAETKANLPTGFTELVIDGGCHAYFGTYGAQEGDGEPYISNFEQINITADAIYSFMCE